MSSPEAGSTIIYKRTAVELRGSALLRLTFQTIGIIYSDIGTSPLYTLNGIWSSSGPAPSREDVIGGVSAILWAITLLPLVKYAFITLRFATLEGEGGSFALFQGLYPPRSRDLGAERSLTGDSGSTLTRFPLPKASSLKERMRWPLLIWCLFGTSLTMADAIFTPAVSVTSAVGGIAVVRESVAEHIPPISIAFLVVLFLAQQFGTAKLSSVFSPIAFVWFLLLAGNGLYNVATYPGILRAFDPSRAVMLFVRTKDYELLAGVLLALTGCEAMFANVGQFNALSIQLSFSCLVYPSIILAYLGQGARLITDGEHVIQNIFYRSIAGPVNGGLWWITWFFALVATLIASQSMITATFSLLQQLIAMKSFPPLRMLYTSDTIQGQIYIPAANWLLMIGTIIIVAAFQDLAAMTNAYGFAVATVMFSTSVLIAVHIRYVKKRSVALALAYFAVFGFLDALFWGASIKKVPHGAWVPLMIGGCLSLLMMLWTWAKGLEDVFDAKNRQNLREFIHCEDMFEPPAGDYITSDEDDLTTYYFMESLGTIVPGGLSSQERKELVRIPTCAVFHKSTEGRGVPHSFVGLIRHWPALPQLMIFLSVSIVPVARVPVEDRYLVSKVRSMQGFYGVTYCVGFRDDFGVKMNDVIEKICSLEEKADPQRHSSYITDKLRRAAERTTHIVPRYHVVSRKVEKGRFSTVVNPLRTYLIEDIYRRLATIFPDVVNWSTSADEIIRVGINASI
ncbi:potassium transporter [Hymenopellis radicata]|nr:potassium transporter [Hymenopellis radicata]